MQVLELIYGFQLGGRGGGIARFGIELSRALYQRGVNVHLCGLFDTGTSVERGWLAQLNGEGINSFCAGKWDKNCPYRSFWRAVQTLWRWQSRHNARIIHSHSEFSDVVAIILKLHPTRPIVIRTVHYGFRHEWRRRPWRRWVLTNFLYILLFDLEIGVSQAITSTLNKRPLARAFRKQSVCIYNAIDLGRFQKVKVDKAAKRKSFNVPDDVPLIGTLGRLTEQKGLSFLLEAVPMVLDEIPQAHFLIVGDGELSENLRNQAQTLGIAHRVIFTGPRLDVEEILGCLDLFVSSSLWEGLPTAILESMAAGIPVVATDIPGTNEVIQNHSSGWLVPSRDPVALAKAIVEALKNPHLRKEFAYQAQQIACSFSIGSIADEYEKLFLSLVKSAT
jgi:glycosyltransferase involved in cell wall biosynthesis